MASFVRLTVLKRLSAALSASARILGFGGMPVGQSLRRLVVLALILASCVLVGVQVPAQGTRAAAPPIVGMAAMPDPTPSGYWLLNADGKVYAFGNAQHLGDNVSHPDPSPGGFVDMVAIPDPTPGGYWLVDSDGRVFAFGAAQHFGDNISHPNPSPSGIVGMATWPNPTPGGYWLLDADGRVLAFGEAPHLGDNFSQPDPNPPAFVGMTNAQNPTPSGYWLVGNDGRVEAFGVAQDLGDIPNPSPSGIVAIAGIPNPPVRQAYWVVDMSGRVFTFGQAQHYGDLAANPSEVGIADIVVTPDGLGYWLVDQQGRVYAFGNAPFLGDLTSSGPTPPPEPPAVGGIVELVDENAGANAARGESLLPNEVAFVLAAAAAAGVPTLGLVWYVRRRRRATSV